MVIVGKVTPPTIISSSFDEPTSQTNDDNLMDTEVNPVSPSSSSIPDTPVIEYQVQAIVRYRLLFTERPKPVLGTSIGIKK